MQHTWIALEIKTFQKKLKTYGQQILNDSIMCEYICTGFIDPMLKGKSLLDYTNSFSPSENEKNDNIKVEYFQQLKIYFISKL